MFHRRLLLLAICGVGVLLVLGMQAARLTLGPEHDERRREAEAALRQQDLIPTIRGRILDRHGRVLAVDDPGWEVAVKYPVITGEWQYEMAVRAARQLHRRDWSELSPLERDAAITEAERPFADQTEMLWQTLATMEGVERQEIDRRRDVVKQRIQATASHLWEQWRQKRSLQLREEVPLADVITPIREQTEAHTIVHDVDDDQRVQVQAFVSEALSYANERETASGMRVNPMAVWSQVELRRPKRRSYPLESVTLTIDRANMPTPLRHETPLEVAVDGVATHILGTMRDVWQEDVAARPFVRRASDDAPPGASVFPDLGGYRPGDRTGSWGIERALEGTRAKPGLRGTLGVVVRHLDTGYEDRLEPQPGKDVRLTIDVQLQARVQALLTPDPSPDWPGLMTRQPWHGPTPDAEENAAAAARYERSLGTPLNGAAVVMEVATGEVLAAVSMPAMTRHMVEREPAKAFADIENLPWLNRVVARPYMPGSTIKPIILAAAVTAGRHDVSHPIECAGPFDPAHPNVMRCWIYKRAGVGHGYLDAPDAIMRSCNVYFFSLGQSMGLKRTIDWYGRFGLGAPTGVGLGTAHDKSGDEVSGQVGNPTQAYPADAVFMGIGQGPVTWTPIQAANAYGILARGGEVLPPTLVMDEHRTTPRQRDDLRLNRESVRQAIEGLRMSANDRQGTTHHLSLLQREPIFNVDGVTVMAKSGTADPGKRWIDYDGDGRIGEGEVDPSPGDHAWCAALVQPEGKAEPTHVIVVVVEYAGSGGQVGGPIANQIIWAMKQEGYL